MSNDSIPDMLVFPITENRNLYVLNSGDFCTGEDWDRQYLWYTNWKIPWPTKWWMEDGIHLLEDRRNNGNPDLTAVEMFKDIIKEYLSKASRWPGGKTTPLSHMEECLLNGIEDPESEGSVMSESTDKKNGAIRNDDGKTRLDLLPFDALDEVGKVLTLGAKKYAPRNWEKGMDWSRCHGSLLRHLSAWSQGENNDPETKRLHMAHVVCNALYLLSYQLRGTGNDDRYKTIKEST